ncbi:hypothetical protein PI124_g14340 [Phytophthora idaei]|nr:hypothetical protein PI125_g14138 [Phytophthora idaei]KAG3146620.1 hypothetical protein PI126_g13236 [Phytophthora idaei]KAG3240764.1 hypothetical protein PI124_g14340 [Phytophthora idaei]
MCSNGTPDEFEAMRKKIPFGKVEKKVIKQQDEGRSRQETTERKRAGTKL